MIAGSRCLVTGGAGFIGRHLVAALGRRGARDVVVVDRAAAFELKRGCLPALRPLFEHVDYVFHLAAVKHREAETHPEAAIETNVDGTYLVARAAADAGVRKVVFASSLYAYGRVDGAPLTESETPHPDTIYGMTKLAGEHVLHHCRREYGLPYSVLRYFFTYGPRGSSTYNSVILKTFGRLIAGEAPVVYGDGTQVLDYVFVDDLVDATIRAAESDISAEVFNVGSGGGTSVAELVRLMMQISGCERPIVYRDRDETFGTRRVADTRKAAERLGWQPRTDLRTGLTITYEALVAEARARR